MVRAVLGVVVFDEEARARGSRSSGRGRAYPGRPRRTSRAAGPADADPRPIPPRRRPGAPGQVVPDRAARGRRAGRHRDPRGGCPPGCRRRPRGGRCRSGCPAVRRDRPRRSPAARPTGSRAAPGPASPRRRSSARRRAVRWGSWPGSRRGTTARCRSPRRPPPSARSRHGGRRRARPTASSPPGSPKTANQYSSGSRRGPSSQPASSLDLAEHVLEGHDRPDFAGAAGAERHVDDGHRGLALGADIAAIGRPLRSPGV